MGLPQKKIKVRIIEIRDKHSLKSEKSHRCSTLRLRNDDLEIDFIFFVDRVSAAS